jgi:hypothetical protein
VDWSKFAEWFHPEPEEANRRRQAKTDFVIRFSRPVLKKTILRDTVVMTAITIEQSSGWRLTRRVPISWIDTTPTKDYGDGLTDQIRVFVDYYWYNDEVEQEAKSWLSKTGFAMEIEIRGDLILDCQRQQVDANARGLDRRRAATARLAARSSLPSGSNPNPTATANRSRAGEHQDSRTE